MQDCLVPSSVRIRAELEDGAAADIRVATQVATLDGGAVQIPRSIENQASKWISSVLAAGKLVEHVLCPASVRGRGQLEYRAVAVAPARLGGSVEVAFCVEISCTVGSHSRQDVDAVLKGAEPVQGCIGRLHGRWASILESQSQPAAGPHSAAIKSYQIHKLLLSTDTN